MYMGKFRNEKIVEKNGEKNKYIVAFILFKDKINLPCIFDYSIYKIIKKMDKNWTVNDKGFIYSSFEINDDIVDIFIHDLVKKIQHKLYGSLLLSKSILHINRIPFDNRIENLQYDCIDKDYNKNIKKKRRTISLPRSSGIKVDNMPTFLWYLKPDTSHGERFFVSVDDINWKSTASTKMSLKYKFEEAKKYLRYLKEVRPDIFQKYSMNGDFNERGYELLNEYFDICKTGGVAKIYKTINLFFSGINSENIFENELTDKFLSEDLRKLNNFEIQVLKNFNPENCTCVNVKELYGIYKTKIIEKLPKYCYNNSDYFYIEGHPGNSKNIWYGSRSNKKCLDTKYNELIQKLNEFEKN